MSDLNGTANESNNALGDDPRRLKGLLLAATRRIRVDGDQWSVPSQTADGTRYRVDPVEGTCSCPDFELRRVRCKHQWAVQFVRERETRPDGSEVVRDTLRVTYSQEWATYNRSQTEETPRFLSMLNGLCSLVEQPEQHRGRPRLALRDMLFSTVLKVYEGRSSRRFTGALVEAQRAGWIGHAPHFNVVSEYMRDPALTPILIDLIRVSAQPLSALESEFAIDSSGFATSGFVRWYEKKHRGVVDSREWVKAHIVVGTTTGVVTSVDVSDWTSNDSPYLPDLVRDTANRFTVKEVLADKQYLGRDNLKAIEAVGAVPFIPFKANSVVYRRDEGSPWQRMYFYFAYRRTEFMQHYHQRSNVEAVFAAIKAKFGSSVRSKSHEGQVNEVLAKVLAYNITVLIKAIMQFGIEAEFEGH